MVEGDDPRGHAPADGRGVGRRGIGQIQADPAAGAGRAAAAPARPRWPMIVLRTPKGWTGPKIVDGLPVEGTWRAHQVPLAEVRTNPEHLRQLEEWLRVLPAGGAVRRRRRGRGRTCRRCAPTGDRRMGANPHANGGLLLRDLELPDFRDYAVTGRRARRRAASEPTRGARRAAARRDRGAT